MDSGGTVYNLLNRQIRNINLMYTIGDTLGKTSMIETRGKISFAYELGLITKSEWESLINKACLIIYGE